MKRVILFVFLLTTLDSLGQNEFAAAVFYNDFRKIYVDAQAGFVTYKGDKRQAEFEELAAEYRIKLLLPLADSGKIVFPISGNPYAIFYFEPDKVRLKVDQRGTNLRDAVLIAFEKPLYARTETYMVNNYPLTTAFYFTEPGETRTANAAFKMSLYYVTGKYYLSFEIRGKNQ
ncbi:MAG: hypothetical protein ABIR30_13130 [Chitinophagaceae bacterium]